MNNCINGRLKKVSDKEKIFKVTRATEMTLIREKSYKQWKKEKDSCKLKIKRKNSNHNQRGKKKRGDFKV